MNAEQAINNKLGFVWLTIVKLGQAGHPEEVGRLLGRHAADAHAVGQGREAFGHVLGDCFDRLAGFQGVRIGEQLAESVQVGRLGQVIEIKGKNDGRLGGEVGVNLEPVQVADDEQRRVLQVLTIKEKLLVRLLQTAALALVFPGELAFIQTSAQPSPPPVLCAPRSKVYQAPSGSAAAGLGWPSNSQRSRKCCCAAERSESCAFFHLAMNSCGVMRIGGHESVAFA